MASKKSKILAIAFCAAVMAGIHVNPVLAYHGEEDFNYQHNTTESGLNNPEIHHTVENGDYLDDNGTPFYPFDDEYVESDWQPVHPEGDVNCEEEVANSNITVGDMNKVTADLVANDEKINGKVDKVASDVKNLQEQVNNIETTTDTDTHVKEGAATVADNGDVTMDIVDKNGDTGKDVTITGLASDSELAAESAAREEADAGLQDQIDGHTNQISSMGNQLDDLKANDEKQDATLEGHTNQISSMGNQLDDLKANDELQDATLEGHTNQINSMGTQLDDLKANDEIQDGRLDGIDKKNEIQDGRLDGIDKKNEQQDNRLDNHEAVMGVSNTDGLHDAYSGTNYIKDANNMAEADVILDREISRVDGRVDRLENRVDGLEDRIDKVGAMSAAIANLRTMGYDPAAPTEVAVGVGQYRDETGMALGLFHYPNRDFMLSLSVSTSGDEYMGGIGATWKFGRKSPEKVAEIKKAQAEADARRAEEQKLAKAEEMKKAAKEAKVQAQMERHAKMLAEQEAQA